MCYRAGNNRLESIQQCVPFGNKTGANRVILLLNNTSHSNLELIPIFKSINKYDNTLHTLNSSQVPY